MARLVTRKLVPIRIHFIHLSIDSPFPIDKWWEQQDKSGAGWGDDQPAHSKIPSIFDQRVRNPSTRESYYQKEHIGVWEKPQHVGSSLVGGSYVIPDIVR
jgi:hypothetical protein